MVRETGIVLDSAGLVTGLRGMAPGVPESAERECEYSDLGRGVCECDTVGQFGADSGVCACRAEERRDGEYVQAEGGADEDGCWLGQ